MTYLLLILIVSYSGWVLYRSLKQTAEGKCSSCSGCSLNGACPLQSLKTKDVPLILSSSLEQKDG